MSHFAFHPELDQQLNDIDELIREQCGTILLLGSIEASGFCLQKPGKPLHSLAPGTQKVSLGISFIHYLQKHSDKKVSEKNCPKFLSFRNIYSTVKQCSLAEITTVR